MSERLIIFDTTLRDGEQSPGIVFEEPDKIVIAQSLAALGVDVIEAGFPRNELDFAATQAVAREVGKKDEEGDEAAPIICALARTDPADIERAWGAIEDADRARIHTFIATSPIQMKKKLRMGPQEVKKAAIGAVSLAKSLTEDVEFSPEDATRSDFRMMMNIVEAAVEYGATTINIPDTTGYTTPWNFQAMIEKVVERVHRINPEVVISAHCHNDLGMAVANSLAAVRGGARQVECTINGIGERAGNAALEEIAAAVVLQERDLRVVTGIQHANLLGTSILVSQISGYPVQFNKAVVGRNAFAHEAGIHQAGVLSDPRTYEVLNPREFGRQTVIVDGKHSGKHGREAINKAGDLADPDFGVRTKKI